MAILASLLLGHVAKANLINTTSYQFIGSINAGSSGEVSQTFSTAPGELYQITFQGYASSIYTPTSLNFLCGDMLNQSLVGDLSRQYYMWYLGRSDNSLVTFNYFATANSDTTTLQFQYAMTSENYGITIRNLSVNLVPDAASTAALLSIAGTGLCLMRRWLNQSR